MELVGLKVKIGLNKQGQADYPLFGMLPVVLNSGMDWAKYIDANGGGWHYDKTAGHREAAADSPAGMQWGLIFVPEEFATQAEAYYPERTQVLDEGEASAFFDDRCHAHECDCFHDHEELAALKAKADLLTLLPEDTSAEESEVHAEIRDAINPATETRGIRKNHNRRFADWKAKHGYTVAARPAKRVR